MTREIYLKKFSRAVRWRLPPQESEEAIADYKELIFQEERNPDRLVEELGDPIQAAHLLTDVRTYRRWLAVFAVLAFGLFLLAKWSYVGWSLFFINEIERYWYPVWVMAAGLLLSLVWFRRHGQKTGLLSRWLLLALAAVLIFAVGTLALTWYMFNPEVFASPAETELYEIYYEPWQLILFRELGIDGGVICALIAFAGLVQAKCRDRRWLALYSLALTTAALCAMIVFWTHSMDVAYVDMYYARAFLFARLIPVGVVGLVGTGVALC